MPVLLTRDAFRAAVFARDGDKCVVCGAPAKDAHHIMERRLWPDGGYYVANGASVCEEHHLAAERTDLTVEDIRAAAGIQKKLLPPHLYEDQVYDKWGNIILENGTRLRGELFYEDTVQRILKDHLHEFVAYVKYPRTYHLPWSPGCHDDDRMLDSVLLFQHRRIIVHEKLDGENTSLYRDHIHARSINSDSHSSRTWVKNFWGTLAHDIPEGWRVCAENMYAKHSIKYTNLKSYLYGFNIWNEQNICLSWDDTLEWLTLLGIEPCPVLYDDIFDEKLLRGLYREEDWGTREGYVVRVADAFAYRDYRNLVAKYVRKGHVQSSEHWKNRKLEPNELAGLASRPGNHQTQDKSKGGC